MAASSTVNITISFLAGNRENISHSIASENGEISYPGLLRSIGFVQEKCNQVLTKVIEDEKSKRANLKLGLKDSSPSGNPSDDEQGDDDDEDEDDDDDDITNTEPPEKKHKT
ncbi:hypothetical protein RRG08_049967 [Elysia crispata]|uniref:EKC/KEOPS complex subunit GON7 n=1 Tax=Elysia crispata TaxID=231223 RepID=A0AAE1BAR5_9GAST|nr:hypothetical protein RRG08_049967 [Elysia crispata]